MAVFSGHVEIALFRFSPAWPVNPPPPGERYLMVPVYGITENFEKFHVLTLSSNLSSLTYRLQRFDIHASKHMNQ